MGVILNAGATPATPAAGKVEVFQDSSDLRIKAIDANGIVHTLALAVEPRNYLINGGFDLAQRQVPTTLTSYAATADRVYAFDRWALSIQTSSLQAQQVDTIGTPVSGVGAPNYLKLKQITGAGKFILSQCVLGQNGAPLRGRVVRVQFKAKYSVAASMTVRLAIIEVTSAGTVDAPTNPWTTAWGANSTDPTLGANLNKLAPTVIENGTLVNGAAQFVLTTSFVRYGATFSLTSTAKNFIVAIWSDSQLAINDECWITEAGLFDRQAPEDWAIEPPSQILQDCQAYYWKSFPPLVAPAQSGGVAGGIRTPVAIAGAVATSSAYHLYFPVPMTKTPTLTFYNPSAGNAFARNVPAATDATVTAGAAIDGNGFDLNVTGLAGWTAGQEIKVHCQAVAEI